MEISARLEAGVEPLPAPPGPKPKCPTCGSEDLERISTGSKVGRAVMLGLFSLGHLSKTFICRNCGYKW
jgi:predicted RNA-binding Zn-ribbon protein involved in translation (DUF1610 family)